MRSFLRAGQVPPCAGHSRGTGIAPARHAASRSRLGISGPDVDSIESWFQHLMDGTKLFNEVNPRPVAAILPVARSVAGRYR